MATVVSPITSQGAIRKEKDTAALKEQVQGWSRSRKSVVFGKGGARIKEALRRFPKSMWNFTAKKGNWNITQVLWHLADHEANLYVRLRRAVAEPGNLVTSYDQNKWSERLLYHKADPQQARDLILLMRGANSDLLGRVPVKAWGSKVRHPELGAITLEYLVGLNIWHLEHHIRQMERRWREWKIWLKGRF